MPKLSILRRVAPSHDDSAATSRAPGGSTVAAMAVPRIAPWHVAAVLAIAWLAFGPPTPDLAAQVYRAGLFEREGWTIFDLSWYGGHHMPAYSMLFPPLGALLGVRLVGALAAVASAVAVRTDRPRATSAPTAARRGALWFAAGTAADLLIGRLTFALGVAFALGAVLALQHGRRRLGLALGALCSLASPVAGLFLALGGIAHWLTTPAHGRAAPPHRRHADRDARRVPTQASGSPPPRSRRRPSSPSCSPKAAASRSPSGRSPRSCCAARCCCGCCPRASGCCAPASCCTSARRCSPSPSPRRWAATPAASASRSPGRCCSAPRSRARYAARRRLVLAARASRCSSGSGGRRCARRSRAPSTRPSQRAYFRPLLAFLAERADAAPVRVEVPFTRLHWEAVHVARSTSLARGWETQLDVKYNALFRAGADAKLTAGSYRAWLAREGVHYVALPDVALDPTGRAEAKLIRERPAVPAAASSATATGRSSRCCTRRA